MSLQHSHVSSSQLASVSNIGVAERPRPGTQRNIPTRHVLELTLCWHVDFLTIHMICTEVHCKLLRVFAWTSLKSRVTSMSNCRIFAVVQSYSVYVCKRVFIIFVKMIFLRVTSTKCSSLWLCYRPFCLSVRPSVALVLHAQMVQDIKIHFTSYNIAMFLDLGVESKNLSNTAR